MPTNCSNISKNILKNCGFGLGQGVQENIYVGRTGWISGVTKVGSKVTAITLKAGQKLLRVQGAKFSNQGTIGFSATDYINLLPQTFRFLAFDNTPETKEEVANYLNLTDVFVLARQNGIDGKWEAWGLDTGMQMTGFEFDTNAVTPAYALTFTAANETRPPYSVIHVTSSLEDTDSYLDGLALEIAEE